MVCGGKRKGRSLRFTVYSLRFFSLKHFEKTFVINERDGYSVT